MALYIQDHGDFYDSTKWDFDEKNIPVYLIGKYPYKAHSFKNAHKLAMIRKNIDALCNNIINNLEEIYNSTNNQQYLDGVDVFLGLHYEMRYDPFTLPSPFYEIAMNNQKTSRYLLSEIPDGTKFMGLSKPKMRYIEESAPYIGKDKNGRALYRDIFLNLNKNERDLKNLVIHELAHSLANHIAFRPDDHHADFKWAEKLIGKYWP